MLIDNCFKALRRLFIYFGCCYLLLIFLPQPFQFLTDTVSAQTTPSETVATSAPVHVPMKPFDFILGSVNFFLLAFFVYYMLVLRPQQRKQEEHQRFIEGLKKNDEVVTSGGIFGRVLTVKPESVTLEISSGVKIRVRPDHLYQNKVSSIAEEPKTEANEEVKKTASVRKNEK